MFFCQVMCWPPEGLFRSILGSVNKARRGRRSSDMRSTYPSHRSLWLCICSMTDVFLGPKTLRLTSVLLILYSHQILPILRRQRWSNTDSLWICSALRGQVSEPHIRTERTATEYTLPFVDNLMSFRRYMWCKLEASRTFWMREDNFSAILPSGVMQLLN